MLAKRALLSVTMAMMMSVTSFAASAKPAATATPAAKATATPTAKATTPSTSASKRVTIYSPHPSGPLNAGIKEFQEKTGITVDLVAAGTGELLKRIEAESANPQCDVFWGGGADSLAAYSKFFEVFKPSDIANIDKNYLAADNIWTGESPLPMIIMYNKKLVSEADVPKSWADLLSPKFKGKIAYADPNKSGSSYTILCTLLTAFGKDDGKGWDFVKSLVKNLDGKLQGSSGDVYKKVSDGEFSVGLTLEKEAYTYVKSGANVGIAYPSEGTSAVPDGIALIKGAKNKDNAATFINFILNKDSQKMMSETFSRRPVRTDTNPPEGLPALKDIKFVDYDFSWASSKKEEILSKWKDVIVGD